MAGVLLPADRSAWSSRHKILWLAWLAMLVLVPITSHPVIGRIFGGRPVNPASLPASLVILALGIVPVLIRGGGMPRPALALVSFFLVATAAIALSPALGISPFWDASSLERSVRGIVTLGIGLSFYLAAVYLPTSEALLRASLRALAVGAVAALVWSSLQPLSFPATPTRDLMDAIHEALFSSRSLFRDRVTGLAYEPSWFADQLVLLYLPVWLAALMTGRSAFRSSRGFAWAEAGLLGWGSAMLVLSASRSGYAAWGVVAVAVGACLGWRAGMHLWSRLRRRKRPPGFSHPDRRPSRLAGCIGVAAVLLGLVGAALAVVQLAARFDRRMARLIELDFTARAHFDEPMWFTIADQLEYAERVVYWTAAARVFSAYPILGVGLGNSGFFFPEMVPSIGYRLIDVLGSVGVAPGSFPNPKSLWLRIPAETGLAGLVFYLTWLLVTAAAAWELRRRGGGLQAVVGLAALLSLAALLVEGFSLDTFALPHPWILPGMVAGLWSRGGAVVESG